MVGKNWQRWADHCRYKENGSDAARILGSAAQRRCIKAHWLRHGMGIAK